MIQYISPTIAGVSALIALLAWLQMRAEQKRNLRIEVEDLFDSLTEQISVSQSVNANRRALMQAAFSHPGATNSSRYQLNEESWESDKKALDQAITDLKCLEYDFSKMNTEDLHQARRRLQVINRRFTYEKQMQREWDTQAERARLNWGQPK